MFDLIKVYYTPERHNHFRLRSRDDADDTWGRGVSRRVWEMFTVRRHVVSLPYFTSPPQCLSLSDDMYDIGSFVNSHAHQLNILLMLFPCLHSTKQLLALYNGALFICSLVCLFVWNKSLKDVVGRKDSLKWLYAGLYNVGCFQTSLWECIPQTFHPSLLNVDTEWSVAEDHSL